MIYRVRKAWKDVKSQIGAFSILDNAKKLADANPGYSVYDEKGSNIYSSSSSDTLYRVRKAWSDEKSQIGAFQDLSRAKILAKKNSGYKVFDANGKSIYDPSVANKNYDKFVKAVKDQASYSYKSIYRWESNPTIVKSKRYGTCVSFVACVLQRYGALKAGQYIWHDGRGFGDGKVTGTITNDMQVIYCKNKTASELKDTLKRGDIVMHDDNKSGKSGDGGHIEIFAGDFKNGKAHFWTGGCGSGHNTSLAAYNNRKILAIVRIRSIQ